MQGSFVQLWMRGFENQREEQQRDEGNTKALKNER